VKKTARLRLGLYGGTFDPVHTGHLLLARDALEQCRLDAVLFIPCAQSPLKKSGPRATAAQRVALLRLALKGEPRFWLSRCELDRPAPSYAIDTAREIRDSFPPAQLFWLLGDDQWTQLDQWRQADELRRLVRFIRLPRAGEGNAQSVERAPDPVAKAVGRAPVLDLPRPRRIDISATEIRRRVKARLPIDPHVPAAVAAYIRRHGLYRS
jgi:nicotinate-nucleotide adenylyltransferase